MSSLPLRQAIAAAWPTLNPGLMYLNTENSDLPRNPPLSLPPVWATLAFDGARRGFVTMGSNPWVVEEGTVTFVIVAKSGHGYVPGVTVATDLMHAWDAWQDTGRGCWFERVGPPTKLNLEDVGDWFLYAVACDYRVQERMVSP